MNALSIALAVAGILGVLFGVRCYLELWRWAKQCQRTRIAIAYKRRVQIQAPLVEWIGWASQLSRDEGSTGRVIYRNHGVSVAILRKTELPSRFDFIRARFRRKSAAAVPRKAA